MVADVSPYMGSDALTQKALRECHESERLEHRGRPVTHNREEDNGASSGCISSRWELEN